MTQEYPVSLLVMLRKELGEDLMVGERRVSEVLDEAIAAIPRWFIRKTWGEYARDNLMSRAATDEIERRARAYCDSQYREFRSTLVPELQADGTTVMRDPKTGEVYLSDGKGV